MVRGTLGNLWHGSIIQPHEPVVLQAQESKYRPQYSFFAGRELLRLFSPQCVFRSPLIQMCVQRLPPVCIWRVRRLNLILTPCLLVIARCQHVGRGSPPPHLSVDLWWRDSHIPTPVMSAVKHKHKQMSHIPHLYSLRHSKFSQKKGNKKKKKKEKRINNFLNFTFWSYFHSLGQQAIMSRLLCDPNKTTWRGSQWLAEGFQNSGHH